MEELHLPGRIVEDADTAESETQTATGYGNQPVAVPEVSEQQLYEELRHEAQATMVQTAGADAHRARMSERRKPSKTNIPGLVQQLMDRMASDQTECMICMERVRRAAAVWSCGKCYSMFHVPCVRKWARASINNQGQAEQASWRCPGCQSVCNAQPSELRYTCFCGRLMLAPQSKQLSSPLYLDVPPRTVPTLLRYLQRHVSVARPPTSCVAPKLMKAEAVELFAIRCSPVVGTCVSGSVMTAIVAVASRYWQHAVIVAGQKRTCDATAWSLLELTEPRRVRFHVAKYVERLCTVVTTAAAESVIAGPVEIANCFLLIFKHVRAARSPCGR
eukprot:jgi/Chlat1/4089/Chrsp26S04130